MANTIFTKELNNIFTEVVNGHLASGMKFHTNTMAGHQGEIAKVDLTDGTDVYRISMDLESCFGKDGFYGSKVVIRVEKFAGRDDSDKFRTFSTLWNGKGEKIGSDMEWYEIGRNQKVWTDSIEFAIECQNKSNNRRSARRGANEIEIKLNTDERRTLVRDMCRQYRGYSRVKRADISKLLRIVLSDGVKIYKVFFNNGKDPLIIKHS